MSFWSWFKRRKPPARREFRPRPADWKKTIDDLMAEKRTIDGEELEWARSYERDQLRGWARFPKDREEYEAVKDVALDYITHWRAPYSGGGRGTLPEGTRIRVSVFEHDPEPVGIYAEPVDYARFEKELVPADERSASKYDGFSLSISVEQLNKDFRLIG